jgi:thioredoxin-related protein
MRITLALAALVSALWSAALAPARAAAAPPSTNVEWLAAAADADVDRAAAQARAAAKPLLLYWGATWCPPCNQLKATLFNRADFAALARSFVAVHVDGDLPGAQKLGARFKVRGYPTLILMRPDGTEITRLPGEVAAPQVMAALRAGLSHGRPAAAVLADARARKPLTPGEWKLLAFYSWETDEARLVPADQVPHVLAELAARAPASDPDLGTRLWLKALAASDDGKGIKPDAALRARLDKVLADPGAARRHMDILTGAAGGMVRVLSLEESPERAALAARFDAALARLQADATLSRGDRVGALIARVDVARVDQPKDAAAPALPPTLVREARETAARMDAEIRDGYERQAVITAAAYLLARAGLWADSDALLKANLARSHAPYYLMSQLAGNARRQGRTDEALQWHARAFDTSVGPATRLEWGARYVAALVDHAPSDGARIEAVAMRILDEAAADPGAFYERSARALERMGGKLAAWDEGGKHAAAIGRLQARLDAICARVEPAAGARAQCTALLKGAPAGGG